MILPRPKKLFHVQQIQLSKHAIIFVFSCRTDLVEGDGHCHSRCFFCHNLQLGKCLRSLAPFPRASQYNFSK